VRKVQWERCGAEYSKCALVLRSEAGIFLTRQRENQRKGRRETVNDIEAK